MCGICGYFLSTGVHGGTTIKEMAAMVAHRGPDGEGFFVGNCIENNYKCAVGFGSNDKIKERRIESISFLNHIALGHRRYSVIALGDGGHQPMTFRHLEITFNGEIYNFLEIKEQLKSKGHHFETDSDTEVILHAFEEWGTNCFSYFNGPFAIVIFNKLSQTLILARDYLGKAPLYLLENKNGLLFSSDIKPLLKRNTSEKLQINKSAVFQYLTYGIRDYKNQTFWEDIFTLPAGTFRIYSFSEKKIRLIKNKVFYEIPKVRWTQAELSFTEAKEKFSEYFLQSIERRLLTDLKVGFTLSGGLDSSAIVAFCAKFLSPQKMDCVTVKFSDNMYNEEPFARAVKELYNKQIKYHVVNGFEATLIDEIDSFFHLEEEPFHSPNLFTDHLIHRKLKSFGIGVNINGAGGDELLGGYESEYLYPFLNHLLKKDKLAFFKEIKAVYKYHPKKKKAIGEIKHLLNRNLFGKSSLIETQLVNDYIDGDLFDVNFQPASTEFNQLIIDNFGDYKMNYWMRSSQKHYLGIPIEPRSPFLDKELFNFSLQLPVKYLIHKRWHKYILRKTVDPHLPKEVTWRKYKMGFPFVLEEWLIKNKSVFVDLIYNFEFPFIKIKKVFEDYEQINSLNPDLLWRLICYALWYQKMIRGVSLIPNKYRWK